MTLTRKDYEKFPEDVKLAMKKIRSSEDIAVLLWLWQEAIYSPKARS